MGPRCLSHYPALEHAHHCLCPLRHCQHQSRSGRRPTRRPQHPTASCAGPTPPSRAAAPKQAPVGGRRRPARLRGGRRRPMIGGARSPATTDTHGHLYYLQGKSGSEQGNARRCEAPAATAVGGQRGASGMAGHHPRGHCGTTLTAADRQRRQIGAQQGRPGRRRGGVGRAEPWRRAARA